MFVIRLVLTLSIMVAVALAVTRPPVDVEGKECISDFDCRTEMETICDRFVCADNSCQLLDTSNVQNECCEDSDCETGSEICEIATCKKGMVQNGVQVTNNTCQYERPCCIQQNWDDLGQWPAQPETWKEPACNGSDCDVADWATVYLFYLPEGLPETELRFNFTKSWLELYRLYIKVQLNLLNNFRGGSLEVPFPRADLPDVLEQARQFLEANCDLWQQLSTDCAAPSTVTQVSAGDFDQFLNLNQLAELNNYFTSFLAAEDVNGFPVCS